MLMLLSLDPAASNLLSLLKVTHATCWLCNLSAAKGCLFLACQILIFPSQPADAAILPSGLIATSDMPGLPGRANFWADESWPVAMLRSKAARLSSAEPLNPDPQLAATAKHMMDSECQRADARYLEGLRVSHKATEPSS